MADKSKLPDLPEAAAHPLSALTLPPDMHFSDDREGIEARMLLTGYGERLADAARAHEPIQELREVVARIIEITQTASYREIRKIIAQERMN